MAVPKRELRLFKDAVKNDRVDVMIQEDLVDEIFYPRWWYPVLARLTPDQRWRFHRYAGRPGWIIQQIVKLCAPKAVPEGAIVLVDSDLVFIRPFSDGDLGIVGDQRILLRREPDTESGKHRKEMAAARRILGLPPGSTEHHYMAYPAIWYPGWVLALRQHIASVHAKPWQEALYGEATISEYLLYGVFVEEVLRPSNLRVRRRPFDIMLWDQASYQRFFSSESTSKETDSSERPLALVVQSNLRTPVAEYEAKLETVWERAGAAPDLSQASSEAPYKDLRG